MSPDDLATGRESRDVYASRATWSRDAKGYVAIRNLSTGEEVEIEYRDLTEVWKEDMRRLRRDRPRR